MKKNILTLLIVALLIVSSFPLSAFALPEENQEQVSVSISLDGKVLDNLQSAFVANGITYVPIKSFVSHIGCELMWSSNRREISISGDGVNVVVKVGSSTAIANNKVYEMAGPVLIVNENAMIPIKFLTQIFNINLQWNPVNYQISLLSMEARSLVTDPAIKLLDYDEAMQSGIRKSSNYQNSLLSLDRAKINNENVILDTSYTLQQLQLKQDLKLYNNWADKQINITMDQISNSIKNQMDDLSLMFTEKKNQQDKIDLMAEKLRIERVSYDYGLTSLQSLMTVQNNYHAEVQNMTIVEQKISAAYTKLNQTLGNPADYRNALEYDVAYAPVGEVDLEGKILSDTYSDPYIWYASQNVDSKELKLNTYEYTVGGQNWALTSLDLTQAKQNLNDTKTALGGVIRERYNSLIQIEEQIRLLEMTLEQARDSVNSIRLQYDLGNVIKIQVEEAQMAIPNLEYQIKSLKQQHEQLKMLFEKPYLAPTYVSGS